MSAEVRNLFHSANRGIAEMAPKGELVDTIHTKYNKWTIYKVYTFLSVEFNVYKNGNYEFMTKDLRYAVESISKKG